MNKNRCVFLIGIVFFIGLISSPGCLTKKVMHGELAVLDQKVEGVEDTVEENQKRIKEHDERLTTLGSIITKHQSQFERVDNKIEEVKRYAQGKLILKEILRNNDAKFKIDSYELSVEAKATLDKFVEKLVAQDKGVYIEIQGHTDITGPEAWNLLLGEKRAEAAMEYLYRTYHIPLHRMEVISFGSSEPVADNSTRQGRAQNRRVEVLVFE